MTNFRHPQIFVGLPHTLVALHLTIWKNKPLIKPESGSAVAEHGSGANGLVVGEPVENGRVTGLVPRLMWWDDADALEWAVCGPKKTRIGKLGCCAKQERTQEFGSSE